MTGVQTCALPIYVIADKEVLYRNAAEQINERYRHYRRLLPTQSAEQIWVYVALEMAVLPSKMIVSPGDSSTPANNEPAMIVDAPAAIALTMSPV